MKLTLWSTYSMLPPTPITEDQVTIACATGDVKTVTEFVNQNHVNYKIQTGKSLLELACIAGSSEVVFTLLTNDHINLFSMNNDVKMPLQILFKMVNRNPLHATEDYLRNFPDLQSRMIHSEKYENIFWMFLAVTLDKAKFDISFILNKIYSYTSILNAEDMLFYNTIATILGDLNEKSKSDPEWHNIDLLFAKLKREYSASLNPLYPAESAEMERINAEINAHKEFYSQCAATGPEAAGNQLTIILSKLTEPNILKNINNLVDGISPLAIACVNGNVAIARLLLNIPHINFMTVLPDNKLVLEELIDRINESFPYRDEPLIKNYVLLIAALLSKMFSSLDANLEKMQTCLQTYGVKPLNVAFIIQIHKALPLAMQFEQSVGVAAPASALPSQQTQIQPVVLPGFVPPRPPQQQSFSFNKNGS
jgi:hypothetical protein